MWGGKRVIILLENLVKIGKTILNTGISAKSISPRKIESPKDIWIFIEIL